MQEHPLIELYFTHSDDNENARIEQVLGPIDLDGVVQHTLALTHIDLPAMLTVMITDDEGIQEMNQNYRDQNKPTDVLSFPLLDQPIVEAPENQLWSPVAEDGTPLKKEDIPPFVTPPGMITNLGDIVISWPTILRQAQEAGHSVITELMYLLSHGVLHLIGYDDQTEEGYQAMVAIQQRVLTIMGQKAYNT